MDLNGTVRNLKEIRDLAFEENVDLSRLTWWKIGGRAPILVEPHSIDQLTEILSKAVQGAVPVVVIGRGTNLFFADGDLACVICRIGDRFSALQVKGKEILAQAGVSMLRLGRCAQTRGLSGLEHAIWIPGTLGGLITMNGGSQRKSISDSLIEITFMTLDGKIYKVKPEECVFSYRNSRFLNSREIILEARLTLDQSSPSEVRREMLMIISERKRKFPGKLPSCGSVFRSDQSLYQSYGPPGRLIEDAGLKGYSIGGLQVSTQHANFFVNKGGATASDALQLIKYVQHVLFDKYGIDLETEVLFVDCEGRSMSAAHVQEASYRE